MKHCKTNKNNQNRNRMGLKSILLMVTVLFVLTLTAGCGNNDTPANDTANKEKLQIGVVQSVEHTSLNIIREALVEELATLGYTEENAVIDYQNGQGNASNLTAICSKLNSDNKDLVIAIGTPTAQAVAANVTTAPILFVSVTDPVGAGVVPGLEGNESITGLANVFPIDQIFDLGLQLTPDMKKIGFLYCSSEFGSISILEDVKKELEQYPDMSVTEAAITNSSELQQVAEALVGKVDAIFVPNDNIVASAMPVLTEVARKNRIPVYVTADSMVFDGSLATVGINYESAGRQGAAMADEILKGASISAMPVRGISDFRTVINQTTADAIQVTIPADIAAYAEIVE